MSDNSINDVHQQINKALAILAERQKEGGSDIPDINRQISALQQAQSAIITAKLKSDMQTRDYGEALAKLTAITNDMNAEAKKIGELKDKLEGAEKVAKAVAKAVAILATIA